MPSRPTPTDGPADLALRPTGREAVREAVIAEASTLFAARGPRAVPLRDVADAAGVNYGLIHRHFGSKAALVNAVVDHLTHALADDLATVEDAGAAIDVADRHRECVQVLAHLCLENDDEGALQREHPVVSGVLRRLQAAEIEGTEVQMRVAAAVVMVMGWQVFEPFILDATGLLDADPGDLRDGLAGAVERAAGWPARPDVP